MVQGQGTTESLKVAGKPPGAGSSLRFKITEALLKDCSESEYYLSYCAEQRRNYISHVDMCGNIFPPVLVPQKFNYFKYIKIASSFRQKMKYFTFFHFNVKIRKEKTKALHPLKFRIEEVKILVYLLG